MALHRKNIYMKPKSTYPITIPRMLNFKQYVQRPASPRGILRRILWAV